MAELEMLQGRKWHLQEIVLDQQRIEDVIGAEAFMVLGTDGQTYGRGGCNRFFGSYSLDGPEIAFGPLASTRMYCHQTMAVEDAFFASLAMVIDWRMEDGALILRSRDGSAVLIFG